MVYILKRQWSYVILCYFQPELNTSKEEKKSHPGSQTGATLPRLGSQLTRRFDRAPDITMSPACAPVRWPLPHALPRDNNTLDDKPEGTDFNWL